jgi:hypothetical protein
MRIVVDQQNERAKIIAESGVGVIDLDFKELWHLLICLKQILEPPNLPPSALPIDVRVA